MAHSMNEPVRPKSSRTKEDRHQRPKLYVSVIPLRVEVSDVEEGGVPVRLVRLIPLDDKDTSDEINPEIHDADDVVKRYRRYLRPKVGSLINSDRVRERDRSKCIFAIVAGLLEAGATFDEVASVLWNNVYFLSKHGKRKDRLSGEINRIFNKIWRRRS